MKWKKYQIKRLVNFVQNDGMILERKTRRCITFYGCSNYPKCKTAFWDKPLEEKCPNCGSLLVEHNNEVKCSSCDYTK